VAVPNSTLWWRNSIARFHALVLCRSVFCCRKGATGRGGLGCKSITIGRHCWAASSFLARRWPNPVSALGKSDGGLCAGQGPSFTEIDPQDRSIDLRVHPVVKLILPRESHRETLADLKQMNITATALFPGLDGFARSLNFALREFDREQIDWFSETLPSQPR
jgi:hypothetical protein